MENERENVVVIMAGYKMDIFFESNPAWAPGFAHHIDFPLQLVGIGHRPAHVQGAAVRVPQEADEAFREYLARRMKQPGSPTAGAGATP